MKVSSILISTAGLLTSVKACMQVHTLWTGDPFAGDILSVQVKDNDVEVCHGGGTIYFSNENSEWCVESGDGCNDGYRVCMTNYGKSGYVENKNANYRGELDVSDTQEDSTDCYCTDTRCLKCLEIETCLDDNYWNCDEYPYCALCDYRSFC